MRKILSFLTVIISLGVVDAVEGNYARIELAGHEHITIRDVKLSQIPCDINEGDIVIIINMKGKSKYKCLKTAL